MYKYLTALFVLVVGTGAGAAQIDDGIAGRLAPVGNVCVQGEECDAASGVATAAAGAGEARSGEAVYSAACTACHATGAAGAPKLGDAGAWAARIDKGMDTLYGNAINGYNGMPAKGLCMDCSEDEVKAAVDYIADNSK